MKTTTGSRPASSVLALCVVLVALAMILDVLNTSDGPPILGVLSALGFLSFPMVGALIASRRPDNAIGWIFCTVGVLVAIMLFAEPYAIYALVTNPGSLPGGVAVATVLQWGFYAPPVALTMVFIPLLFPDGRLPSRRWRPVPWLALAFVAFAMVYNGLSPGPIELGSSRVVENPTGIDDAKGLLDAIGALAGLCGLAAGFGAVTSIVLRFRRARGDERQQLKWFSYAAALVVVVVFAGDFFPIAQGFVAVAFPLLPAAAGIAILKYRLYEIDRIISRTIVYALVSGSVVAVYAATVFVAGTFVAGPSDNLTVAIATLVAAAAFRPLRGRLQALVDRRFNRRKYDAAKTIGAFGSRLREETDLEELTGDLVSVVRTTMQPRSVSLWLREQDHR
jgi:hypothetical protein